MFRRAMQASGQFVVRLGYQDTPEATIHRYLKRSRFVAVDQVLALYLSRRTPRRLTIERCSGVSTADRMTPFPPCHSEQQKFSSEGDYILNLSGITPRMLYRVAFVTLAARSIGSDSVTLYPWLRLAAKLEAMPVRPPKKQEIELPAMQYRVTGADQECMGAACVQVEVNPEPNSHCEHFHNSPALL
jgi:hypothetical protein